MRSFAAVCDEAAELFDTEMAAVGRFEADEPALVTVGLSAGVRGMTIGMRTELGDWLASTAVYRTGRTARRDVTAEEITGTGPIADAVRAMGFLSTVSAPIVVEGRLWGVMTVSDSRHALAPDTEKRIENFTELIATAIANREARDQVTRLLDEQSALRRVATLVAESPVSEELFSAVAREVAGVLNVSGVLVERFEPDGSVLTLGIAYDADLQGADAFFGVGIVMPRDPGSLAAQVFETRRTARVDDYSRLPGTIGDAARAAGLGSGVAGPILVDGELWGQMCVFSRGGTVLPVGTENRLHDFIELVATAISNYEAHAALQRLADEQAAQRRIATLVAQGATPNRVFDAVRDEVARMFNIPSTVLMRFDADGMATLLATYGDYLGPVGTRWPLEGDTSAVAMVHQTGRAARADYTRHVHGSLAQAARRGGVRYPVAVPVVVEGALWGAMSAGSYGPAPPSRDLEGQMEKFTELLATAISNADSRAELAASEARAQELANEQAALRRVATLVAKGVAPDEVFAAVAEEVAVLFDRPWVGVMRYDSDASFSVVATWGEHPFPPGSRWPLDGPSTPESVLRTGRPARISDYTGLPGTVAEASRNAGIVGGIGAPIIVEGITWGMIAAPMTADRPIPDGAEVRLNLFTKLLATAISNADSRAELAASEARAHELAHEQAALRRVATLVAKGTSADELFAAVAYEVASVVGVPVVGVCRYEADGTFTMLGIAGETSFTVGSRWPVEDEGVAGMIVATGRPARKDDYTTMPGPLGAAVRDDRMVATVGVPIVVEGDIWGFMVAASRPGQAIPTGTEERLARFTELVATAVSNATMRGELVASRARVIAAGDDARRRIERDLHDGAQQQLVTLALAMRSTEGRVPTGQDRLKAEVGGFADRVTSVVEELREMSRGIHPAVLSEGGLSPALEALALRSAVPVKLNVLHEQRLPDAVEVAAYYVASEALTNASKHADASRVEIDLYLDDASLRLSICDDGGGGADPSRGSGLIGLKDRVEALGGTIDVESPHGRGTRLQVAIPVLADSSAG